MSPLFTSLNLHEIHHLKNLLAAEGIASFVKNEMLSRLAGEVPFTECAPQLCLAREDDRDAAEAVLAVFHMAPAKGPDWTCRQCAERCEGQFSECWSCGMRRPD